MRSTLRESSSNALKAWFCVEALTFPTMAEWVRNALASVAVGSPPPPGLAAVGQEAPAPVQVRLLRALGIVAQTNDLAQSREDRRLIVQTGSRAAAFAIVLRAAILVAVDADGVRRLLELPRLRAYPTADLGQVWWTPNFGPSAKVEQRPVLAARRGVCR